MPLSAPQKVTGTSRRQSRTTSAPSSKTHHDRRSRWHSPHRPRLHAYAAGTARSTFRDPRWAAHLDQARRLHRPCYRWQQTRKLEFVMADAIAQRADTVITFGAVQSNHARQTAAACAKLGLACHLILTRRVAWQHPEYETNGNVLLDRLLGAHVHVVESADAAVSVSAKLGEQLGARWTQLLHRADGGSNSIGALGYLRCAVEIVARVATFGFDPTLIVHATSSGGTQTGLIAGCSRRIRLRRDRQ